MYKVVFIEKNQISSENIVQKKVKHPVDIK